MEEILKISLISYMFSALGEEGRIFHFYRKLICRLPEWLCRPLGGCAMCFTGQVCLWYYLLTYWKEYNYVDHLFFASAGIFLSLIYDFIYKLIEP